MQSFGTEPATAPYVNNNVSREWRNMTLGLICRPYSNYYNGVLLLIIYTTVDNCRIVLVEYHLSLIRVCYSDTLFGYAWTSLCLRQCQILMFRGARTVECILHDVQCQI